MSGGRKAKLEEQEGSSCVRFVAGDSHGHALTSTFNRLVRNDSYYSPKWKLGEVAQSSGQGWLQKLGECNDKSSGKPHASGPLLHNISAAYNAQHSTGSSSRLGVELTVRSHEVVEICNANYKT